VAPRPKIGAPAGLVPWPNPCRAALEFPHVPALYGARQSDRITIIEGRTPRFALEFFARREDFLFSRSK
jgi:hypothetical protein